MWNFLKYNLYCFGGSVLTLTILFLLLLLTRIPKEEPNTIILFLLNTIGLVAVLGIFGSIIGTIADCWRVFIKGEQVEGFKWESKLKSKPTQEIRTESPKQMTTTKPTQTNDPLGIR